MLEEEDHKLQMTMIYNSNIVKLKTQSNYAPN